MIMPLCEACHAIPFEQIFKYMNHDESVQWPGRIRRNTRIYGDDVPSHDLYHAWHESIQVWLKQAEHCSCCRLFLQFCEDNYYYKDAMANGKGQQQVWFNLSYIGSFEAPQLRLVLGSEELLDQDKIISQIRFCTTPGTMDS
jgi:hypothetical protein